MTKPTLDDLNETYYVGKEDAYMECIDYTKYRGKEFKAYREGVKAFYNSET